MTARLTWIRAASLVALVIDEAHKATGSYAYVTAVRLLTDAGVRFRILALSATPGTTTDKVQVVVRNLHIAAIEFRSEDDEDVARYTHKRNVDVRVVQPSQAMHDATVLYTAALRPLVGELMSMRVLGGHHDEFTLLTTPYMFREARTALSSNAALVAELGGRMGRVQQLLMQCHALARGLELLYSCGMRPALEYLLASGEVVEPLRGRSPPFAEALRIMQTCVSGGAAHMPKLTELVKVVRGHFAAAKDAADALRDGRAGAMDGDASGEGDAPAVASTRAIVFSSSRESVKHVMEELAALRAYGVIASEFIGQGESTAAGGRERKRGQTQAEQSAILGAFRKGAINVIVATCIGEEGLDVPQVDLVVFMDAVGIVRLVQRMGRTGRAREGTVVVLAAEGKEHTKWINRNAECVGAVRLACTRAHVC